MTLRTFSKRVRENYKKREAKPNHLLTLLMLVLMRGLFIMLGLGVLHNDWTPSVPALGFWASVTVSLMLTGILKK